MLQKVMRHLFTGILILSLIACQSRDTVSMASSYPRFARDSIRKVEQSNVLHGSQRRVSTFVGATPRGAIFVAVSDGYVQSRGGAHDRSSGQGGHSFAAHPLSMLLLATKNYTVDLTSVFSLPSLHSCSVIVGDDGVITMDPGLLQVVYERQNGVWKTTAVHCQFPKNEVSEKELRAETAALKKTGWGDITFPPGHGEREERYRIMLLNYVAAKHVKFSYDEVYSSEETSTTYYLANLLYDLIEKGVPVSFQP
ncbi:hypothetical protein [Prosthecobacter sp.]|uniref:hypothetical protein n=1 Tax=Prosthecobacter sp. TaxID=1965333 RepID=UPI003784DDED